MTPEQYARYTAAMITGYTSGVGGSAWLYCPPPSGDGVNTESSLSSDGSRTLYVIRERLVQYGQPLPAQPVGVDRWRVNAPVGERISTGGVVISQADATLAYSITSLESDQGFPTGLVEKVSSAPDVSTAPKRSVRAGLRIGAW